MYFDIDIENGDLNSNSEKIRLNTSVHANFNSIGSRNCLKKLPVISFKELLFFYTIDFICLIYFTLNIKLDFLLYCSLLLFLFDTLTINFIYIQLVILPIRLALSIFSFTYFLYIGTFHMIINMLKLIFKLESSRILLK